MGKYIRKSKATGEVAVSHAQSSLGVRTRTKTLLDKAAAAAAASAAAGEGCGDGCYMQLRSRRLEKPATRVVTEPKRQKHSSQEEKEPNYVELNKVEDTGKEEEVVFSKEIREEEKEKEKSVEASFGENVLEFEGKERTTRESTLCSLSRDLDTIRTPGTSSRTVAANNGNSRMPIPMLRDMPTAHEISEFFSSVENDQHQQFIEKYNFDPLNEKPLPGRYEWVKLKL